MRLSAETIIEHIQTDEAIGIIKENALTIAQNYSNNIRIEVNVNREDEVKLNITEFNL